MGYAPTTTLIYGIELYNDDILKIAEHFNVEDNLSELTDMFNEHEEFKEIAYGKDARFHILSLVDGTHGAVEDQYFNEDGFTLGIFVAAKGYGCDDKITFYAKPANHKAAVALFKKHLTPFLAKLGINTKPSLLTLNTIN